LERLFALEIKEESRPHSSYEWLIQLFSSINYLADQVYRFIRTWWRCNWTAIPIHA